MEKRASESANKGAVMCAQVAMGFVHVANEAMCRPIRALTQMRGYDVAQHVLACFGGAGGQHACAMARNLGMRTIFVHRYAGVLSAVGIGLADVVAEEQVRARSVLPAHCQAGKVRCICLTASRMQEPSAEELGPDSIAKLNASLDRLQEAATERLRKQVPAHAAACVCVSRSQD